MVNHIDENRLNNTASNLEWCTVTYNNNYGTVRERASDTLSTPVMQFTLTGKPIAVYRSTRIASEMLSVSQRGIQRSCRGEGSSGGYIWKFCTFQFWLCSLHIVSSSCINYDNKKPRWPWSHRAIYCASFVLSISFSSQRIWSPCQSVHIMSILILYSFKLFSQ